MRPLARLSLRLMLTLPCIAQAVDRHVAGSAAVLEMAFPTGMATPRAQQLRLLRRRDGHFFGLWRHSEDDAELRLRTSGGGPRTL